MLRASFPIFRYLIMRRENAMHVQILTRHKSVVSVGDVVIVLQLLTVISIVACFLFFVCLSVRCRAYVCLFKVDLKSDIIETV